MALTSGSFSDISGFAEEFPQSRTQRLAHYGSLVITTATQCGWGPVCFTKIVGTTTSRSNLIHGSDRGSERAFHGPVDFCCVFSREKNSIHRF